MRLWSLHPRHLDPKGLVALWREGLLAQKVLRGKTKGYRYHPQLERFKAHPCPQKAIASFLTEVWKESIRRGYHFDERKILKSATLQKIPVTTGQLKYERAWLDSKIKKRAPVFYRATRKTVTAKNRVFHTVPGKIASWEKVKR